LENSGQNEEQRDTHGIAPPPSRLGPDSASSRRRTEIAAATGLLVLVVLVILGTLTPLRDMLTQYFFAPTPTATLPISPGDDLFYFEAFPTGWGTISVDGHPIHQSVFFGAMPIRLGRGAHQVIWQAAPFTAEGCIVYVPSPLNGGSSCKYELATFQSPTGQPGRLIRFSASLDNLSNDQQAALSAKVQAALDAMQSTGTVQPGERYVHAQPGLDPAFDTAQQPLRATLRFVLDTNPNSQRSCVGDNGGNGSNGGDCTNQEGDRQDCHLFCTSDFLTATGPGPIKREPWNPDAVIYTTWDYKTLGGQTVAQDQADISSIDFVDTEHLVSLFIDLDSAGWHVTVDSASGVGLLNAAVDPGCGVLEMGIGQNYQYQSTANQPFTNLAWGFFAAKDRAAGCLGVAVTGDITMSPTTPTKGAYFLYRFGVLLAVNNLAHQYFPDLPLTDVYEQGIAQQIVAMYRPVS